MSLGLLVLVFPKRLLRFSKTADLPLVVRYVPYIQRPVGDQFPLKMIQLMLDANCKQAIRIDTDFFPRSIEPRADHVGCARHFCDDAADARRAFPGNRLAFMHLELRVDHHQRPIGFACFAEMDYEKLLGYADLGRRHADEILEHHGREHIVDQLCKERITYFFA